MKISPTKLRGQGKGPLSELTRLKTLWRSWPDGEKQKLLGWREEGITNAEIRSRIKKYYSVNLVRDGQLSEFWSWCSAELESDAFNEFMAAREQSLTDNHPESSREQIREAMIKEWYAWSKMQRDPKLGLKVVNMDLKDQEQKISQRKLELLEKKAAQADQAKGVMENKELTEDQRAMRMREIFGIS
jgi:hypothetical protein